MYRDARRIAIFIFAAALAAAFASACKRGSASGGANDVAATVNGKDIMLSEVDNTIKQQTSGQQASLSPLELGAARLQVLDDLIKQEVLYQRADKEKLLPTDDEISQVVSSQKQQVGSQEEFQKALKESGQTEEGLREVVRKRLAMQKLLDRVGSKVDPPSDKEIEDFYNSNRERYVSARGVQLSAIVVDPQDNGAANDAKGDMETQNKINIVYQRLKSGGDFATVAREQSEDPNTTRSGGDIGFVTEDDLKRAGFPPELISKFFSNEMQVGDITPPTKGSDGRMSIFKLTARRLQSENLTLDNPEVRKDAADTIINQRKQIVNAALLEVAMREAKIENKLAESMLNSANSLSSLRPAGAAPTTPAAPNGAASPQASASPAAHAATPATNANNAARPNANAAANRNAAAAPASRNTNAAPAAGNANR
ncbi:MAG: SurA N-terminal domain-containing protein [Pyrinomonadaceae bacterium]